MFNLIKYQADKFSINLENKALYLNFLFYKVHHETNVCIIITDNILYLLNTILEIAKHHVIIIVRIFLLSLLNFTINTFVLHISLNTVSFFKLLTFKITKPSPDNIFYLRPC